MRAWSAWVALLERREDARSLAAVRILGGATAFWHLWSTWSSGALAQIWVEGEVGAVNPGWLAQVGGATARNVEALALVGMGAAALTAVGLFSRPAALLAWFCLRILVKLNGQAGGSMEELVLHTMLLLGLSGAGGAWSLDSRWRGRRDAASWPRWVMILQLVLMYTSTGLQKLSSSWVPGGPADALWYIYQQPQWSGFDITRHPWIFPFTQVGTTLTWLWEVGAPVLLLCYWARATRSRAGWLRAQLLRLDLRSLYVLYGLGFHLLVEATMHVGVFSMASLALYPAFFHPDELARGRN